jgi:hypothetical protein
VVDGAVRFACAVLLIIGFAFVIVILLSLQGPIVGAGEESQENGRFIIIFFGTMEAVTLYMML